MEAGARRKSVVVEKTICNTFFFKRNVAYAHRVFPHDSATEETLYKNPLVNHSLGVYKHENVGEEENQHCFLFFFCLGMESEVGDFRYMQQRRRQQAIRQRNWNNPDWKGRLSVGAIIVAFGLLIGAIAVFTFHWVDIANEDAETRRGIDALQVEFNQLNSTFANISVECNCTGINVTFPTEFADNEFTIFNAIDPSKLLRHSLDNITAAALQLLTVQNRSGVVAYLQDIPVFPTVFLDSAFTVVNALDNTKAVMLNCSVIGAATTRTMTVQDASGVIAYLSDIPVPTSVFQDDEFAVRNAVDTSKEMMLDVSVVGSGINVTMTIQDADGTIAYLSDLPTGNGTFSDAEFAVVSNSDPTALVRLDVSTFVSPSATSVMTVQDGNGTIAYLDQTNVYNDVIINSSRNFPDPAFESASTLSELGVTQIQIWLCGGGGGGAGGDGASSSGGGGGSGSGVEKFFVDNVGSLFSVLNCTIGAGGAGGTGSTTTPTNGGDGGVTSVIGVPLGETSFLEVFGYGGGGGQTNGTGGAGGGSGGSASGNTPGSAGNEGGLAGGVLGIEDGKGALRYPWHAGSAGGQALVLDGAPWIGGGDGGLNGAGGAAGGGGGAGGLFGTGGDGGAGLNADGDDGGTCAGGGGAGTTDSSNSGGAGGNGLVHIRYWMV